MLWLTSHDIDPWSTVRDSLKQGTSNPWRMRVPCQLVFTPFQVETPSCKGLRLKCQTSIPALQSAYRKTQLLVYFTLQHSRLPHLGEYLKGSWIFKSSGSNEWAQKAQIPIGIHKPNSRHSNPWNLYHINVVAYGYHYCSWKTSGQPPQNPS